MGMDVNAVLLVGLSLDKLDITKAPYYDDFIKEDYEYHGWQTLVHEFYYDKQKEDASLKRLDAHPIFYDDEDESRYFFGFLVADSGSWDYTTLEYTDLVNGLPQYQARFKELFGVDPEIILYPRYW